MSRTPAWPPAPEPLPVPVADNHCHLDMVADIGEAYDGVVGLSVDEALARAAAVGVTRIVQIGCDLPSARWSVQTASSYPSILAGVAIHPNEAPRLHARGELDAALAEIEVLSRHPRVRVVGETGLDHFRTDADGWAVQEAAFRAHIDIAKRTGRALQIHDRDAHEDVLRVLESEGAPDTVIFHCFSGDADMARRAVEAGYLLSFAGTVTFKNAGGLREALKVTPLEHLLVETDAPFLAPAPHRGQPNASYLIPRTLAVMAQVLDVDLASLCTAIDATTERVFGPF
ncbi:MAG TPA: TatD family hydrolase [Actinomycetes bacterium]|nr:TatD family hydrolase [Actinomycetes bacterium]